MRLLTDLGNCRGRPISDVGICSDCPASLGCLWATIATEKVTGLSVGIAGGLSSSERAPLAAVPFSEALYRTELALTALGVGA